MTVLILSVTAFVLYLIHERKSVDRWRKQIPQTVIVTGTRGKSTTARLLASVLRSDGRRVLAKTTGSQPTLLWPDGSQTEIRRRGQASVLEQKGLLELAASLEVDCLVAEVMSIHAENHIAEARQLLKPDVVAVTNTWPDHTDAQGETEDDVAATLSLDVVRGATVFLTRNCRPRPFEQAVLNAGGRMVLVDENRSASILSRNPDLAASEFADNLDLVCAVAIELGMSDEVIEAELASTAGYPGAFSVREIRSGESGKTVYFVDAFAANDPVSTERVFQRVASAFKATSQEFVGLLCLRPDRGDRTRQWIDAIRSGRPGRFRRVYVAGGHAMAAARSLESAQFVGRRSAERITASIVTEVEDNTVVFGFGNFVGLGQRLTQHWDAAGVVYGV